MEFCALASGSSGNCIYVGHDDTRLLVDAGISGKKIAEGLAEVSVLPEQIQGILITHDHCDHIQGAAVFARKYNVPLYGTALTLEAIERQARCAVPKSLLKVIAADRPFDIGSIEVRPFTISHDALDPVSYTLSAGGRKVGFATDLGIYTDYTVEALSGCDALYIEANHDVNMLMLGTYAYSTKLRIDSPLGHLSNEACAELIEKVRSERLKNIVLGHISKENNLEELAYETVRLALREDERFSEVPELIVANRYTPSKLIRLE